MREEPPLTLYHKVKRYRESFSGKTEKDSRYLYKPPGFLNTASSIGALDLTSGAILTVAAVHRRRLTNPEGPLDAVDDWLEKSSNIKSTGIGPIATLASDRLPHEQAGQATSK